MLRSVIRTLNRLYPETVAFRAEAAVNFDAVNNNIDGIRSEMRGRTRERHFQNNPKLLRDVLNGMDSGLTMGKTMTLRWGDNSRIEFVAAAEHEILDAEIDDGGKLAALGACDMVCRGWDPQAEAHVWIVAEITHRANPRDPERVHEAMDILAGCSIFEERDVMLGVVVGTSMDTTAIARAEEPGIGLLALSSRETKATPVRGYPQSLPPAVRPAHAADWPMSP